MPGGRPKKHPGKILYDNWEKDIIELYRKGASDVEIRAYLVDKIGMFSQNLWTRWLKEGSESKDIDSIKLLDNWLLDGQMPDDQEIRSIDDEEYFKFWITIKKGRLFAQAWWEDQGRTSLNMKDFSYVGWYMQMKNKYGWKDKHEIEQDNPTIIVAEAVVGVSQAELDDIKKNKNNAK